MPNPYVNKVVRSNGTTLIDISDTTAVASDVASGKYFYLATGEKVAGTSSGGGTAAISVVDTTDSHGGTVREITALDISDTTAVASDVAQGKYFYTAAGVKTAGTASGGGTPSATAHTLYFEFTDETNTTITAYWDDSFISDAITESVPTTYGQKTVTLAQLDGVTWYSYDPTERWETLYENNSTQYNPESDPTVPPYCWITSLSDVYPTVGSVWRITFNGVTYRCTAVMDGSTVLIGNPLYGLNANDDGSGVPFAFYNAGWGAWSGAADLQPYTVNHIVPVKIERRL